MIRNNSGQNITKAFKIAADVGDEIERLYKCIDDLIQEELMPELYEHNKVKMDGIKSGKEKSKNMGDGWVCSSYSLDYRLHAPRSQTNFYASILFHCLVIPNAYFPGLEEPLFSVCYSDDTDEEEWEEDFLWDWGTEDDSEFSLRYDSRLMTWNRKVENYCQGDWAFSIPLVSLRSIEDVKSHVIEPIIKLLTNSDATIFNDNSPAIQFDISENGHGFVPKIDVKEDV